MPLIRSGRRATVPAIPSSLLLVLLLAPAAFAEIIEIRSGQVGGVPGTPPTVDFVGPVDDCFRAFTATACGTPLSGVPFSAADFSAARAGAAAELVAPAGTWLASLPADPGARWVNWNHGTVIGGSGDPARSALYACDFVIETPCPSATLEIWESSVGDSPMKAVDAGTIEDIGPIGLTPIEGWFYPEYVADVCPGLPDFAALRDCADQFAQPDTFPKGRLLDYPADWESVETFGGSMAARKSRASWLSGSP